MPRKTQDISSYLKATKKGIWRFRLKVPVGIQKTYGKVEESFSLETTNYEAARTKGSQYLIHFKDRFAQFANPNLLNLDAETDFQKITGFALQVHLKMDAHFKAMPAWQRLVMAGNMNNDAIVKGMFSDYLKSENIVLSESNERYDYLLDSYKNMALERLRYHHVADHRDALNAVEDHEAFSDMFIAKDAEKKQPTPFINISVLLDLFLKENNIVSANKDEVTKFKAVVTNLIDYLGGDKASNLISRDDAVNFMTEVAKYPVNRPKDIRFTDAIKLQSNTTISQNTFISWLKRLRRLYEFAQFRYPDSNLDNPFAIKMKFLQNKGRETEDKRNFKSDELKALLAHTNNLKETKPHHYWLPLLLLYHGSRNGEFANRELKDVRQEFGIWVIDLTVDNKAENIRVKNDQSKRMVPICQELIKLGFIDYVNELKLRGERWLFPQFNRAGVMRGGTVRPSKKPSQQFSSTFARIMDTVGLPDPTISLHSFRHTWISQATKLKVSKDHRVAIVGHGGKGDVHDHTYTHEDLLFMKEALDSVSFEL